MAQPETLSVRIFVSSPGDVAQERVLAQRVIDRLREEFIQRIAIEAVFWEHEPCLASDSFQTQISRASQSDICLILFWSRLGTPLTIDGVRYESGTEYEFRDALDAFNATGSPNLLVYRKTEQRMFSTRENSDLALEIIQQQKAVDSFITRWFRAADGSFIRAFHEFDTLAQFEERLEEHLRNLIEQKLLRAGYDIKARPRWSKGSPFRGLAPFDEAHKDIFFGRTAAVHDVLNALRRQAAEGRAFVLVNGMSGAGKSSLVRAGVLPILTRPGVIEGIAAWRHAVFRPSQSGLQAGGPIDGLATAFLREEALPGLAGSDLPNLLRTNPQAVLPLLKRDLGQVATDLQRELGREDPRDSRLALIVDQLEELFIDERISPAQRNAFAAALSMLARSGLVWVLATLRSDFYGRLAELPDLMALKEGTGHYDLRSPTLAEIGLMIRKPAQMANLKFDVRPSTGEQLDDVLCAEAAKDPAALPLLQFTLEALYERRTADGLLTFAAYDELGGLEGALATRAEQVFASLSSHAQQALPRVLTALVRLGAEKDEVLAQRRVPVDRITANLEARALVKAFTDKRLFVTDSAEDGTPVLSVAHEALLRRWPRIQEWAQQNRHLLRARAHIAAALALWASEGKNPEFFLHSGRSLEDGRALLSAYGEALTQDEQAFITASLVAESQRRHRRLLARAGAAAATIVLLAGGGLYWFLNQKTTVEYYADLTNRWGVPEGVGPISDENLRKRDSTLKFIRRGTNGPVERIEVVNAQGSCPTHTFSSLYKDLSSYKGATENVDLGAPANPYLLHPDYGTSEDVVADRAATPYPSSMVICRWEFETRDGRALEEHAFDRAGHKLYTLKYSGNTAQYVSNQGYALPLIGSGVSHLQLEWGNDGLHEGRPKIVRFTNAHGSPKPDRTGKYGFEFEYNKDGLPVRITHLGRDGRRVRTQDGIAVITISYDQRTNPIDFAFLDESNRPTRDNENNVAGFKRDYDPQGNLVRESYFDLRGRPTVARKQRYWVIEFAYDDRGHLIKTKFIDEKGNPARDQNGVSAILRTYNEQGVATERVFLDEADRRIRDSKQGIAGVKFAYDDRGRISEETYLDEVGQPTLHNDGYVILHFEYDQPGNIKRLEYRGASGRPTQHKDGYAALENAFNDIGQLTKQTYFDEVNRPIRQRETGYANVRRTYDDRGNLASEVYFDENGSQTRQRAGYAEVRWSHDSEGRIVEKRFLDEGNRLIRSEEGYAIARHTYNDQGKPSQVEYFDEESSPTTSRSGYAKITYDYDARGNKIQEDRFYQNGQLGWRIQTQYNDNDAPIHLSFWEVRVSGEDPTPAMNQDNCYQIRYAYDDNERPVEIDCMNEKGKFNNQHVLGYDREKIKRGEWGNIEEQSFWTVEPDGGEKAPEKSKLGYSMVRFTYDSRGRRTEQIYYNKDTITTISDGYARVRLSYDERGNWIEKSYHDTGGRILNPRGSSVAKIKRTFNDRGKLIEQINLDTVGRPVRNATGFAKMTRSYDNLGNLQEIRFLDETDRPALIARTFTTVKYEYEERGNVREMRYLNGAGRSIPLRRELFPRSTIRTREYPEIEEVYKVAAERGNADAQNMLGWMHETGRCVRKDSQEAREWYNRAVAQGDSYAMSNLGMMMLTGKGKLNQDNSSIAEEFKEGSRLLRRSAGLGNPFGQTNLGLLYIRNIIPFKGSETERYQEAMVWFRRAAEQNNGLGQSHLGTMYEMREGAAPDYQEAARYYRLAAENGEPDGMVNLGLLYLKGRGVERDDSEGARWIRKAATLGHPAAQANLGFLYAHGRGVRNDPNEAIRWYTLALANDEFMPEAKQKAKVNLMALRDKWFGAVKEMLRQLKAEVGCSTQFLEPVFVNAKLLEECELATEGSTKDANDSWKKMGDEEQLSVLTTLGVILAAYADR